MYKHMLSFTVLILTIILLSLISTFLIYESIETRGYKEESLKAFTELKNKLSTGNITQFSIQMRKLFLIVPTLKTLRITNSENLPLYLISDSKKKLQIIETDFDMQNSSINIIIYKNEFFLNNLKYNLEAAFTISTNNRLFKLLMKIAASLFIYIVLLSWILIYINFSKANSGITQDPVTASKTDYHNHDQLISDELKKSAAFDQDLVLTLIGSNEKMIFNNMNEFEEILHKHFPFHDLIFRYDDNTFGILLPNTDLEQGIHQIELFDQIFVSSSSASLKFPVMFGLSSRNGRLISGSIILKEAKVALTKAKSDKNYPIVGFRPNPARYREYISKLKSRQ